MRSFSGIPEAEHIAGNDLAFAILDRYPVSPGHAIVVTRREIRTWWEATPEERIALFALIDDVRSRIDRDYEPDGYNIGINAGSAAGQTVPHLHVHVIPRYRGDVPDPTGGVRAVIPGKANYLARPPASSPGALITPDDEHLLTMLRANLNDPAFDRIDFVVSFVMRSGVLLLLEHLDEVLARGGQVRLLTTDYLTISQPAALGLLLDRIGNQDARGTLEVRVHQSGARSFHPKAYLFSRATTGTGLAIVGSSNLSAAGIRDGVEWNLRTAGVTELLAEFDRLWTHPDSTGIDAAWLAAYHERYEAARPNAGSAPTGTADPGGEEAIDVAPEAPPEPWALQVEALGALEATRIEGHTAGLVVMATGLGKTWLAAFDTSRPSFRRVLFVAHREEILQQSRDVFRQIRPGDSLTMFTGRDRDAEGAVVFASIQMLAGHLDAFDPGDFDYVVIDEFHHAAARTYRRVISHFAPKFLLGLTATPERADAADLLALCHDNLVFECGLATGIDRGFLAPFTYRAIRDVADYAHLPWRGGRFDTGELSERLETARRADQVLEEWRAAGGPDRRTIGFCCSIAHADFMRSYFRAAGVRAAAVHSGPSTDSRLTSIDALVEGTLDVIFTVDLFNEGIDVPTLDVVMLLRPTESPVVFFQQIGRGLRTAANKERLQIIDLVANHRSSFLKARLLCRLGGAPDLTSREAIERLRAPLDDLPPGCEIIVDTELVEDLSRILNPNRPEDRIAEVVDDWVESHGGARPSALEISVALRRSLDLKRLGGWFGFLGTRNLLTAAEEAVVERYGAFLRDVEHGAYQKSYKLLTLLALLEHGSLADGLDLAMLSDRCREMVYGDPRLLADLNDATAAFNDPWRPTAKEWNRYWERNPIAAWVGRNTRGTDAWFEVADEVFRFVPAIDPELQPTLHEMVREIAEYRLHRYLLASTDRLAEITRKPRTESGQALNATFVVQAILGRPVSIKFESAGGARDTAAIRNPDYVAGIDVVMQRLHTLGATVLDAFVDSGKVQHFPIPDRRLDPGDGHAFPLPLTRVDDLENMRRALLRSMALVGRASSARAGGGNSRKAFRIVLTDLPPVPPEAFADYLEGTLPPGSLPVAPARRESA